LLRRSGLPVRARPRARSDEAQVGGDRLIVRRTWDTIIVACASGTATSLQEMEAPRPRISTR
jgi:hypothetical protein